ncbi:hypothetical protein K1719_002236 [Acacia pycnantha]|nr:hypothetical protein K1719_002236 [Acacia pycnantha]
MLVLITKLGLRDTALENVKEQIRSLEMKLDSVNAPHLKEKEAWGLGLQNVEETWRIKYEAMKAETEGSSTHDMQLRKELEELKQNPSAVTASFSVEAWRKSKLQVLIYLSLPILVSALSTFPTSDLQP